jgi:phospholipase/lecithinase/hemolysin
MPRCEGMSETLALRKERGMNAVTVRTKSIVLLATLALASANPIASAQSFTRAINFGDSLSDVGNTNSITFGISPGSNYYNGRYSNGPVWTETLAQDLSLPATKMSRSAGGLDYATGGSRTGSGNVTPVIFINLPNAGTQINSFLSANTPTANDLVTLWTGANDFIDGQTDPNIPANNVKAHVQQLVNAGVKNILVINLPPLGETPRYRTTADRAPMNAKASQFNLVLSTGLDAIAAASPSVTLYRADMFGLFNQALTNPAAYGFTNVTEPALRSDNTVVSNPDDYLFYDTIHPTRVGHAFLADFVFETVTTRTWSAGSGGWSVAATWAQHRVPDSTSAVTLATNSTVDAVLNNDVTVRKLRFTPETGTSIGMATLHLADSDLHITDALDLAGGTVAMELDGQSTPRVTVGGRAALGGTLLVGFTPNYIALPGMRIDVLSFATASGSPTVENDTAFAGLTMTPVIGTASLSIDFSARPGDADLDAIVGFSDLVALAQHYDQPTGQTWLEGDFTHDAAVSFGDLVLLAQNYDSASTFDADWALAQSIVPEPATLAALLLPVVMIRRSRFAGARTESRTTAKIGG